MLIFLNVKVRCSTNCNIEVSKAAKRVACWFPEELFFVKALKEYILLSNNIPHGSSLLNPNDLECKLLHVT